MRIKACISWPYRTFMIPYFFTNSKEKVNLKSKTFRLQTGPGIVGATLAVALFTLASPQRISSQSWFPGRLVQQNTNDRQYQPVTYKDDRVIRFYINDINIHERKDTQR
jgi:hypothetical protein